MAARVSRHNPYRITDGRGRMRVTTVLERSIISPMGGLMTFFHSSSSYRLYSASRWASSRNTIQIQIVLFLSHKAAYTTIPLEIWKGITVSSIYLTNCSR